MTREEVLAKIKDICVEKLCCDESKVTEGASFADDLDADSIERVELLDEFQDAFGATISDEEAEKIATVGDAIDLITKKV